MQHQMCHKCANLLYSRKYWNLVDGIFVLNLVIILTDKSDKSIQEGQLLLHWNKMLHLCKNGLIKVEFIKKFSL